MFARVLVFVVLACSLSIADVILQVSPSAIEAHPGTTFDLFGTVTNTGSVSMFYVGSGFCCLNSVITDVSFPTGPDPLLPGDSAQFLLATFTLAPDAPLGNFTFSASVFYTPEPFVCEPACSPITDEFSVEVVPEPSTGVLVATAISLAAPYQRMARSRRRRNHPQ